MLIPKIITAAMASGEDFSIEALITIARRAAKDKKAPARWVNPLIGSRI
jgi:hypothetical protein